MTDPDVVAELDRWIGWGVGRDDFKHRLHTLERARDEIAALREKNTTLAKGFAAIREATGIAQKARAEALEEAAALIESFSQTDYIADAMSVAAERIRALKDKPA